MPRRLACALTVALLAALLVVVAGCGSSSGTGSADSASSSDAGVFGVTEDPLIAAGVPQAIASKGSIVVAADATYAPNEFIAPNSSTVVGMDADLAHAIGAVLGLNFEVVNATFATIIPGLQSGKYDLGMSSFTDTKERERVVDFVTYFSAGTSFYTKVNDGSDISGLADLCGRKVGVENGTTQQTDANAQDRKCRSDGKPGVAVSTFPDQSSANIALAGDRVEIVMADSPVADYAARQSNDQFKLIGQPYGAAPYGIAIPKDNGMATPVLGAVRKLVASGVYEKILEKWGLESGAIDDPVINGAIG
jgi:polar amino acid transport system substrate-binding protein